MTTASEFQAKVDKAVDNMDTLDAIVNGSNSAVVQTDNGEVPSMAKVIKDFEDEADAAVAGYGDATTAANTATAAATIATAKAAEAEGSADSAATSQILALSNAKSTLTFTSNAPGFRYRFGVWQQLTNDGGGSGVPYSWGIPVNAWPMRYDSVTLQMDGAGTGHLLVLVRRGNVFEVGAKVPITVSSGLASYSVDLYVPPNGALVYQRATGGYVATQGFLSAVERYYSVPDGLDIGDTAVATPRATTYGFSASGHRVDEAPGVARVATQLNNNAYAFANPARYIIATWLPRASELTTWESRGINTAIVQETDFPFSGQGDLWETTWREDTELDLIRRPGRWSDPDWTMTDTLVQAQADAVDPRVIAWNMVDEPDVLGHPDQPNYGGFFEQNQTRPYVEFEIAQLRMISPTKPIFCNLGGYQILIGQDLWRQNFLDIPGVNWWGTDQYPNATTAYGLLAPCPTPSQRYSSTVAGIAAQQVIGQDHDYGGEEMPTAAHGKPYLHFIATSPIYDGKPAPTPAELNALVMSGIINGAMGHCYFPQFVDSPYDNDATPSDLLTEMPNIHERIDILNGIDALIDPVRGGRRLYRIRHSPYANFTDADQSATYRPAQDDQMPAPFEACEIPLSDGDTLRLILNLKGTTQSLTDAFWGYSAVSFAGLECKAFLASAPTVNLFA